MSYEKNGFSMNCAPNKTKNKQASFSNHGLVRQNNVLRISFSNTYTNTLKGMQGGTLFLK